MNLDRFWQTLDDHEFDTPGLNCQGFASVLIAITASSTPEIVLTKRPESMNTHAGQVAFPGGRWEQGDLSLAHTALRETQEEIDLAPEMVVLKGRLPAMESLHGLMVYPFVATIPEKPRLKRNPAEIESIFQVPLSFFMDSEPDRIDDRVRRGVRVRMPAWYFDGYEIWGLTAVILDLMRKRLMQSVGKR